jgi:hypothetical protein
MGWETTYVGVFKFPELFDPNGPDLAHLTSQPPFLRAAERPARPACAQDV